MNKGRHLHNTVAARRALVQCAPIITGSTIDPSDLSRCALSKEIISEDVDKKVKDRHSGDTTKERMDYIIDEVKDRIRYDKDGSIFPTFLSILGEMERNDLVDKVEEKYKELDCKVLGKRSITESETVNSGNDNSELVSVSPDLECTGSITEAVDELSRAVPKKRKKTCATKNVPKGYEKQRRQFQLQEVTNPVNVLNITLNAPLPQPSNGQPSSSSSTVSSTRLTSNPKSVNQQKNNPFIMCFIRGNISKCHGCKNKFPKKRAPPKDLCIKHKEWREYTQKENGKERRHFSNVYYHCKKLCISLNWDNFDGSQLDVSEVRDRLEPQHKEHISKEFELQF